jgi:hypothetical protein
METTTKEPVIEVLPAEEIEREEALAVRAEKSLLQRLENLENAEQIIQKRTELIEALRISALRRTRPQDWVLSKDKQGNETGMLTASGAQLVAEVYGVRVHNVRPLGQHQEFQPEKIEMPNGVFIIRAWCDAVSEVNGRWAYGLEASRRSDEDFTGRSVDESGVFKFSTGKAYEQDLRSAVFTLMLTKAVRILCGMTRVPPAELTLAWKGTAKSVAECRRGHGYGSSQERTAGSVAEGGVKEKAVELGNEILRRVGGDTDAASSLLLEITQNKEGKFGKKSIAEFTKLEQVEWATNKLKKHAMFGDEKQREPGDD